MRGSQVGPFRKLFRSITRIDHSSSSHLSAHVTSTTFQISGRMTDCNSPHIPKSYLDDIRAILSLGPLLQVIPATCKTTTLTDTPRLTRGSCFTTDPKIKCYDRGKTFFGVWRKVEGALTPGDGEISMTTQVWSQLGFFPYSQDVLTYERTLGCIRCLPYREIGLDARSWTYDRENSLLTAQTSPNLGFRTTTPPAPVELFSSSRKSEVIN